MSKKKHHYLIHLSYLGFRYHGWQWQPGVKTIQLMLEKTFQFILDHDDFKIIGASRTDAMVSANNAAFEFFIDNEQNPNELQSNLNKYLPPDIRIENIEKSTKNFNVINDSKSKEYLYLFSNGEKFHPFCASLMTNITEVLDIKVMQETANLFVGKFDFTNYCYKPNEGTNVVRVIDHCSIDVNTEYIANFFPEKSYVLRVRGSGFLRNQIRIMMGVIFETGKGNLTMEDIKASLSGQIFDFAQFMAPPSGLILNSISFN